MRRVAVTGIGVISPLGNSVDQFFRNLVAGRSGISRLPESFNLRLANRVAGQVDFDGARFFEGPKLRMLDRVSQFALAAASQAISDAGGICRNMDAARAGVFMGTGMGGAQTTDEGYLTVYQEQSERVKPFSVLMAMNNAAASWIGIDHGLYGPNLTFSTACSSSAVAIGEAFRRIAQGEADVMLAGGSEAPLTFGTLKAWEAMRTLAVEDLEDASASCKPFSRDRTGLVLGEGATVVALEEWARAKGRGVRIYAEITGYGLSTDPLHITRPSVAGQAKAMELALQSANIDASSIDYINAHGTATLANDAVETAAIKQIFGSRAYSIPVSSTKSMHGHLLGAAGAIESAAAALALQQHVIPPTRNLRHPDPECDLDYVPGAARQGVRLRAVMSNAFAFGGTNAVLICKAA